MAKVSRLEYTTLLNEKETFRQVQSDDFLMLCVSAYLTWVGFLFSGSCYQRGQGIGDLTCHLKESPQAKTSLFNLSWAQDWQNLTQTNSSSTYRMRSFCKSVAHRLHRCLQAADHHQITYKRNSNPFHFAQVLHNHAIRIPATRWRK